MATSGFWGIIKNGEEKMIYNHFDSYPEGLGKDVVFLIQNNLECLSEVFEKIIFVKSINNLDSSEARFILISPTELVDEHIKKKYFCESAKEAFERNLLEYGYMIDLDTSLLKLYENNTKISDLKLEKIKFADVQKAFDGAVNR